MRMLVNVMVLLGAVCACSAALFPATSPSTREGLTSGWMLQSSCGLNAPGGAISTRRFKPQGWYATRVPSTVLATLVAAKVYPDPYYGMNLRSIPGANYPIGKVFSRLPMPEDSPFRCSWWYRTEFKAPSNRDGKKVWLNFGGINYRANVWVNGKRIANSDDIAGTYRTYEFDITDAITADDPNVLAVEVFAPTENDLAVNWVDWNPSPPDKNMGLWGEVYLTTSGPVSVRYPQVISRVDTASLRSAELTVTAEVRNTTDHPITGELRGSIEKIHFAERVNLAANEMKLVTFAPGVFPQLKFANPRLWWPWQMGAPNLYTLNVEFESAGQISDHQTTTFGIREVTSELTDKGYRLFKVNGKEILIRGGGWAPDMMLRSDPARDEQQIHYVRDLGLNTIRLEGKLESDSFYDLTDRYGILVMPGWCCCDIWEKWSNWKPGMLQVATDSLKSQVLRMRNHPSIFVWLNGSDNPPTSEVEEAYLDVLKKYSWPNPVLSSATARPTQLTGPSGVKMTGPYDYVPPEYWYTDRKLGGAYGYNTETSPGAAVPPLESLRKFIPKEHLWPIDDVWNYHAGGGSFTQINLFNKAMNDRYGKAHSLKDFVTKSQALAYDGERAMFEAYSINKYTSTGVIQWMLNNAWPSIIWHLYDYYLMPGGGYFGVKKANEPLHVAYAYDDHSVAVVNSTYQAAAGLRLEAKVYNFDLTEKFSKEVTIDLASDSSQRVFALPEIEGLSITYFVKLQLHDAAGKLLSDNFYWLSTKPVSYDYGKSTFFTTPVIQDTDLTMLNTLPQVEMQVTSRTESKGSEHMTHVRVRNPSKHLAFMVRLRLTKANGDDVLPIRWSDNFLSLLPGEERDIVATYAAGDLGAPKPVVRVEGWNIHPLQETSR